MGVCYLLEHYYAFIKEGQSVYLLFLKLNFLKLERLDPEFQTWGYMRKPPLILS